MNTCVMTKLMMVILTFRMEQGVMTANVYRTQSSKLTSKEALQILQNHDQSLILQILPWRPKAGEIYLISSGGDDRRKMIGLMMVISGLIKEEIAILGRRKYCGGNITA